MKRGFVFWLGSLLIALVWGVVGFLLGGLLGSTQVAPHSGLAGAGTVAFFALLGAAIGLVGGGVIAIKAKPKTSRLFALLGLCLALIAWFSLRGVKRAKDQEKEQSTSTIQPALPKNLAAANPLMVRDTTLQLPNREKDLEDLRGLGFADVRINLGVNRLLLYPNHEKQLPFDSLVLEGDQVLYAPPYLLPYYMKLDYQQLTLRLLAVSRDRLEVELNAAQQRRGWVDREQVDFAYWPDFLLQTFSVEPLKIKTNPLRIKPLEQASTFQLPQGKYLLHPVAVNNEWIAVRLQTETGEALVEDLAWLRWRKGKALLVSWDYRL